MTTSFNDCLNSRQIGEYQGRTVHKLNTPLIWTHNGKRVEIPAGFETDLASVPRLPIIYLLWGNRAHREAVLHDYLYRMDSVVFWGDSDSYSTDIKKEDADWLFREAMIGQGQPYYIYHPMYLAVRTCGESSFHRMKVMDHFEVEV